MLLFVMIVLEKMIIKIMLLFKLIMHLLYYVVVVMMRKLLLQCGVIDINCIIIFIIYRDKCTLLARTEQRYSNFIRLIMKIFDEFIPIISNSYSVGNDDSNKFDDNERYYIYCKYSELNELDIYYNLLNSWLCLDYKKITIILQSLYNNKWAFFGEFSAKDANTLYELNKSQDIQLCYFTEKQNQILNVLISSFKWLAAMTNVGFKFCEDIINELTKIDVKPGSISLLEKYIQNYLYFPPIFTLSIKSIIQQLFRDEIFVEKFMVIYLNKYTAFYSDVLEKKLSINYTLLPLFDFCLPVSRLLRNTFKEHNILETLFLAIPILINVNESDYISKKYFNNVRNRLLDEIINHILLFLNPIYSGIILTKNGYVDKILDIFASLTVFYNIFF